MERRYARPTVVVSKCIEFGQCRFDGSSVASETVKQLREYAEFVTICPECEIGLGVPRNPVQLVLQNDVLSLIQTETEHDCTSEMLSFSKTFLSSLERVDGFILKFRSPSCGIKNVKIFPTSGKTTAVSSKGRGIFADKVYAEYPFIPVEDEDRLQNIRLREHFLTTLFTLAEFREICTDESIKQLAWFQSKHSMLFMLYNQTIMRQMGRLAANKHKMPMTKVFQKYEMLLLALFSKLPNYASAVNVLQQALDNFNGELSEQEQSRFCEALEQYKGKEISLSTCNQLLLSWATRDGDEKLLMQSLLAPFPQDLVIEKQDAVAV